MTEIVRQYEITAPENEGQQYYIVPKYISGMCWGYDTEEQAKEALKFITNREVEVIDNIRKIECI